MIKPTTIAVALVVACVSGGTASAQMQLQSGHALDGNLNINSGGYNSPTVRSGPVAYPTYVPGGVPAAYRGIGRQYSPYSGGWQTQRQTNYDTYLNDRSYDAGWQRSSGGYSSYAGPPGGYSGGANVGAYKIDTRVGG
ncbi:MAG: hypothetical protein U0572_08375 [Phycisphaerales bacterium]